MFAFAVAIGVKQTSLVAAHMSAFDPKQTWPLAPHTSAFGGKADIKALPLRSDDCRFCPKCASRFVHRACGRIHLACKWGTVGHGARDISAGADGVRRRHEKP